MSNHLPAPSASVACPMCGKENRVNEARPFCTSCGARLAGGPSTATPAPVADARPPAGGTLHKAAAGVVWLPGLVVLISLLAALPPFGVSVLMALTVVLFGGAGWLLWKAGDRAALRAREQWMQRLQLQVMHLARTDPQLTVMEVSTRMGWPVQLAEQVLDSLEDGLRVNMMPDDNGVMIYTFHELMSGHREPPLLG